MYLNKLLISLRGLLCKEEVVSRHNCAIHLNTKIATDVTQDRLAQRGLQAGVLLAASPDHQAGAEPSSCHFGRQ